jgi:peptide/nickel transport system ATP-binding protein/oligopeptide transport system ATP-binding protein
MSLTHTLSVPNDVLLDVRNLTTCYPVRGGLLGRVRKWVQVVDKVSLQVKRGETLGLVGESGCGKTTLGRSILRLVEPSNGEVLFDGQDILTLPPPALRSLRRHMQIIYQDPLAALDPRMRVGDIVREGLIIHRVGDRTTRRQMVDEALEMVGLRPEHARRYPHEFSGGEQQRIGIARALVLRPRFLICDEPVSALDVSIQSQILNLLSNLQAELGLTYLFIAHNLSVVGHVSDRVAVMYLGRLVELADRAELYANPLHPYTQALMSAVLMPSLDAQRERIVLKGDVPDLFRPPSGCRFHPRCPVAIEICPKVEPEYRQVSQGHWVACHLISAGTTP